jgi:small subunit ribosomal protein S17
MPKKNLTGVIVSDKMDKTVVVKVETLKKHPRYQKRYRSHKKYFADNPTQEYKVGDQVVIEECRPLSRLKKWRVVNKAS